MSKQEIKVLRGTYVNADGEEKQFLAIDHPEHSNNVRLLNKKRQDGEGRLDADEMINFLKETPDWRNRLEHVEHPEFGEYFTISMVNYATVEV